jgi:UDP-glucose 4-epimerase
MRVLITGGAGFIGSHLCDALVTRGDTVTILDNLSTSSQKNIAHLEGSIKVFHGDIRNKDLVEDLVEKNDLILHMAAAVGVHSILMNPIESISINYHGSETVLNASAKYEKRILIASTSEIYGKNSKQPLSETDDRLIGAPQKIRWSYSDAKALEEAAAYSLYLTKNLKVTTVRFFNTVGPRQTGKYGMVIPRFILCALQNQPVEVYGTGLQTRVFCHIDDAVEAVLKLSADAKTIGEVFNVGGIGEISVDNLAKFIVKELNSKSQIIYKSYDTVYHSGFEDIERRVPDISKIERFTGWKPKKDIKIIVSDIAKSMS